MSILHIMTDEHFTDTKELAIQRVDQDRTPPRVDSTMMSLYMRA